MTGALRARRLAAVLALALIAGAHRPAAASLEQFSTLDVAREEEDDESLLDHFLARPPREWRDEWERSANAFRTTEGCLTAGQWMEVHDLKLRAPTGKRSHMDLLLQQVSDNEATWEWLQFEFRFPLAGPGLWGVRFRPSFDKSRQDFAAMYDLGDDSSRVQLQAVLTIEDTFNELWSFRQTRVGERGEPYERHPFEPALRVVARGTRSRIEASGQWLTPSRRRIDDPVPAERTMTELWGTRGSALAEMDAAGFGFEARYENVQALGTERRSAVTPLVGRTYRRRWTGELAARRAVARRWTAEARWVYQDRAETWRPPSGDGALRALDRMPVLELAWTPAPDWRARFGLMRDRVGVATHGAAVPFTYGTRNETRLYVGLQARFGRITVQGVEGIELDTEPYDVSFHHDKGFLHLQTTF